MCVEVQVVKVTLAAESIAEMGKLQMLISSLSEANTDTTSVGSSTPSSTSKNLALISTWSNSSKIEVVCCPQNNLTSYQLSHAYPSHNRTILTPSLAKVSSLPTKYTKLPTLAPPLYVLMKPLSIRGLSKSLSALPSEN